jgi:hypothetical protein
LPIFTTDGKSICFIHIPKCGGTSINARFHQMGWRLDYYDGNQKTQISKIRRNSPQHSRIAQLDQLIDLDMVDFTFALVRDPFARIVSEYKFQRKLGWTTLGFQAWVGSALARAADTPAVFDSHLRPASDFIDPRVATFRLEDQRGALLAALNQHVPEFGDMPVSNVSAKQSSDDFTLDAAQRRMVFDMFSDDFARFYPDAS